MYFNVNLAQGRKTYLADSKTCEDAMGEVLNGCPPFNGDPLVKYGGSVLRERDGSKALWEILIRKR